jgi:chromosomal replication initiation ATPase DnaA
MHFVPSHAVLQTASRCSVEHDAAIDAVVDLVAQETSVRKILILSRFRCRVNAVRARHLAIYLSHVALGRSLNDVATAFGRDRTTVSYACALIEDLRDDAEFDQNCDRLEAQIISQLGLANV